MVRRRLTFAKYLALRLGSVAPQRQIWHMFSRAFTAPTFRRFWYYWNPLYGYSLLTFCHAPLRRVASAKVSFVITFAISGFLLHDFPVFLFFGLGKLPFPVVSVAFVSIALFLLLSERFGITLHRVPRYMRVALHLAVIGGAFSVSLVLSWLYHHAGWAHVL